MSVPLEDEFGDIVRKARVGHGLATDDLSRVTAIAADRLSGFEAYRLKPSKPEVGAIASALELHPGKLWEIAEGLWWPKPEPWKKESRVGVGVIPVDIGGYSENCYLVRCSATGRAMVVDPGGSAESIADCIQCAALVPEAIAITHGHSDHTAGAAALAEQLGIRDLYAHPEDVQSLGDLTVHHVSDGVILHLGEMEISVLHTPGHTRGHVCYLAGGVCFVGDTLFAGSVGNAQGGPNGYQALLTSVRTKLLSLPEQTALLPGHGPATTVGEEREHNPFF